MKYLYSTLFFLVILFAMAFQSPKNNSDASPKLNEYLDISYALEGEIASHLTQLNVVMPEGVDTPPVFLWIGGGAWAYVNRHKEMEICRNFAKKGIAVISVGHRLSPALIWPPKNEEGIKHPEHVKDVARAFRWAYQNADSFKFSKENIFIGGYSSGAHLAALLTMDDRYLEELGLSTDLIRGCIPVAGGYDIPDYKQAMFIEDSTLIKTHINVVFGETMEEQLDASPTSYLDSLETPMLSISESYTYPFCKILEEKAIEAGFKNFQALNAHNLNHNTLWFNLRSEKESIYRNFIADFIHTNSKN
jgi:dienelactone hydrolase